MSVILRPDLGNSLAEVIERGERVRGAKPMPRRGLGGHPSGLSVGQEVPDSSIPTPTGNPVLDFLATIGVPPCRIWGAEAPNGRDANGCPLRSKVCGAIYPYLFSAVANTANQRYEMFAKVWFWPLYWADVSGADISVARLEYTEDPVFENSAGTGVLDVNDLMGPGDYYGFVPGLPAFDNKVPLVAFINNAHAMNAENFEGMFIGISIRN